MTDDPNEEKKKLKMSGRGSLTPPKQASTMFGPNEMTYSTQPTAPRMTGYWKNYRADSTNTLLDESEHKKHTKDYGMAAHNKKDFKKRVEAKKQASSGSSTARYIPRMR